MSRPDPVTGADIRGLREDTQGLTTTIEEFATKADVKKEAGKRHRSVLFGALAVVVLLAGGLYMKHGQDEIIAQRKASRAGLCAAIDDMRVRHNHFVQTTIDEREAVIAETLANPNATDKQKADSEFFFRQQIAKYQQDLLVVIDCDNPDALASLFTKPGGK